MNFLLVVVSKNVVELEVYFKVCLINCIICSMSLIEVGEVYWQCLECIFDDFEVVDVVFILMQQGFSGLLWVSVLLIFVFICLILVILVFFQCYLDLCLELFLQDGCQDLIVEGIDLVLCGSDWVVDFGLVVCLLLVLEYVFCVVLVYFSQYGQLLWLEVLCEYECICFSFFGYVDCWIFCKGCECIVVFIVGCYWVFFSLVVCDVLFVGFGLSLILWLYVQVELVEGCLVELLVDWKVDEMVIYVVYLLC